MKISIAILAMSILMLGALAVPVMAVSPKKIPVTVTGADNASTFPAYIDVRYSETGEIAHISIVWTGQLVLHVGGDSFTFDYVINVEGNGPEGFTLEDGDKVQHDPTKGVFHVKEVWTYTNGESLALTDTFEGVAHWTMSMPYITQFSSRIVLQGSGVFKGQMLSLSGTFGVPPADNTYYGYLLVP